MKLKKGDVVEFEEAYIFTDDINNFTIGKMLCISDEFVGMQSEITSSSISMVRVYCFKDRVTRSLFVSQLKKIKRNKKGGEQ